MFAIGLTDSFIGKGIPDIIALWKVRIISVFVKNGYLVVPFPFAVALVLILPQTPTSFRKKLCNL